MWPKAIAQLIELLPHAARLLPVADKFFQGKTATDDSSRRAMDAMAEGLRGDLGQVTASHAGLYRQLNDQSEKLALLSTNLASIQAATETNAAHLARLEQRLDRIATLLLVVTLLAVAALILLGILLHRSR